MPVAKRPRPMRSRIRRDPRRLALVYRAWDARLDREVALKLIPAEAPRTGTDVIHEGRLLARVRHNNVVTIHGAEQIGNAIGIMFAVSGRREEALALAARHPDSPSRTMLIHAGLGDKDRAFEGLNQTAEINWWRAVTWMHRPEMSLLRDDPRMPALKKRRGLPP